MTCALSTARAENDLQDGVHCACRVHAGNDLEDTGTSPLFCGRRRFAGYGKSTLQTGEAVEW